MRLTHSCSSSRMTSRVPVLSVLLLLALLLACIEARSSTRPFLLKRVFSKSTRTENDEDANVSRHPYEGEKETTPSFPTFVCSRSSSSTSSLQGRVYNLWHTHDRYATFRGFRGGASPRGNKKQSKLANLAERTLPAVVLLVGLYFIVTQFGDAGLQALLLALTPGLYQEAVSVVLSPIETKNEPIPGPLVVTVGDLYTPSDPSIVASLASSRSSSIRLDAQQIRRKEYSSPWWWFFSYSLPLTLHHYLSCTTKIPELHLVSFSMIVISWMAWVIKLNSFTADDFGQAWKEVAVYHMAFFLTVCPVAMWMRVIDTFGKEWALYTALLVILNDTTAYLFGFTLGKNPLLPTISPKKTWEGWVGALIATTMLSEVVWNLFFTEGYNTKSFIIALFCSIVAPFGGFMASTIKRAHGKKDFSNLIAGHGGLVDRLDCQLVAAPFLYFFLKAVPNPPFMPFATQTFETVATAINGAAMHPSVRAALKEASETVLV